MHANFTDHSRVAALGDADSYATRLFDYEHSGRDPADLPPRPGSLSPANADRRDSYGL